MPISENELSSGLKQGILEKIYYLYGKESYLTKLYCDRIIEKAVGKDPMDFNYVRINGNPDPAFLSDNVDGVPVFSEKKAIFINDLDAEKADKETLDKYIDIFSKLPPEDVVVISITGFEPDTKKSKTKALISAIEKNGAAVEFVQLSPAKITEMIMKSCARNGVVIDRDNARYLSELTLRDLTLIRQEIAKLCSYIGKGGTIRKSDIDTMTTKQLDTGIYTLATAITSFKTDEAFRILDELISEGIQPVVIMSALAGTFIDFYRAKIGKNEGKAPNMITSDFNYPKNRAWVVGKAVTAVGRTDISYLRSAIATLSDADFKLKSSPVDSRIIIEQTMVKLMVKK